MLHASISETKAEAAHSKTQQVARVPAVRPSQDIMLQRKCACGLHTVAGGECVGCRKKQGGMMQPAALLGISVTGKEGLGDLGLDILYKYRFYSLLGNKLRLYWMSGES